MNGLEIKNYRIKKGYTQDALAKLLGVSKNTILNYEKGKTIPDSKNELLEKILLHDNNNILQEPYNNEYKKTTGYDKKLQEIDEQIKHHYEIVKLLNEKKEIIKSAKYNHENDL